LYHLSFGAATALPVAGTGGCAPGPQVFGHGAHGSDLSGSQ